MAFRLLCTLTGNLFKNTSWWRDTVTFFISHWMCILGDKRARQINLLRDFWQTLLLSWDISQSLIYKTSRHLCLVLPTTKLRGAWQIVWALIVAGDKAKGEQFHQIAITVTHNAASFRTQFHLGRQRVFASCLSILATRNQIFCPAISCEPSPSLC